MTTPKEPVEQQSALARLSRNAFVHTTAPADAVCARCDEPIALSSPAVSVPGLHRRGLAHEHCVPRQSGPPHRPGGVSADGA